MKKIKVGKSNISASNVALGCMRIADMPNLAEYLNFCVENGVNFFDHADIYGAGECEKQFAKAFKQAGFKREDFIIQSKCGLVPGVMYDLSEKHILEAVDGILKRLDTDYLDFLALHRPDALFEPEEIAGAFDKLEACGKVRNFGVSNFKPYQIKLLKKYVKQDINVNQMQFSLPMSSMISSGIEANMLTDGAIERDGSVLDYCRINDITLQAWSPFQHGFFGGPFIGNTEKFPELNKTLDLLSEKYNASPAAVAAAWILRHPAKIQVIAGTTNIKRMGEVIKGSDIELSREDWYKLYIDSGHMLP